jgi:anthranilate phosphoribosyltransferase
MDVAAEVDPSESLFAQRAEELFEQISYENAVSSESASLVVALAYLNLEVTEEEVVEATRGILKPRKFSSRKMFSLSLWSCCDGRHL